MPDYIKMMIQNTEAFTNKDTATLGSNLAEDYSSFRIEGGEAIKRTANKADTLVVMEKMFEVVPLKGSHLEWLMVIGDHVVAVEKDIFDTSQGERTTTTLGVYHMQDGKIWRAYSFPVQEEK